MISGKTLIDWGFVPGKWFKSAIKLANKMQYQGHDEAVIKSSIAKLAPPPLIKIKNTEDISYFINLEADNEDEVINYKAVKNTMDELMRTPVVTSGAVMPDACPAGAMGTIPVGGVIASTEIHPGAHSADICCSLALTNIGNVDPKRVLDAGMRLSHFGGGGRKKRLPAQKVLNKFNDNYFLSDLVEVAHQHLGTQGDGNHFYYVGVLKSTGQTCIITHHGSRKPGALLYKKGMKLAENYRKKLSPETRKQNAWIPYDTDDGRNYWDALQIIRQWTKTNHFIIHDLVCDALNCDIEDRFWNEHNFVFKRDDLFYHGKGATPAWKDFADDTDGRTLIPLNMAEPILIAKGLDAKNGLGFSPHGAGRNFSRSEYIRRNQHITPQELICKETANVDARFYSGVPDLSELPGAYKNANAVKEQIKKFGLAEVEDEIIPYGSIMAGNWFSKIKENRSRKKSKTNTRRYCDWRPLH